MKKTIFFLLLLLAFSRVAFGQNYTTVTSTVKDSNNTLYIYGNFSVSLLNSSGQQATFGGNPSFLQTYSGALNASGVLSIVLPSVTIMSPSGLQWQFFICANPKQYASVFPQPSNSICFSYTSTGTQISGASVDLSASMAPSVVVVPLSSAATTPPAGSNTQVQFNNNGAFGADGNFTYGPTGTMALGTVGGNGILSIFGGGAAPSTTGELRLVRAANMICWGGNSNDGCLQTAGLVTSAIGTGGFFSTGTNSVSGCSLTAAVGGQSAGKFASGTAGTCTVTITLPTSSNGWTCDAHDLTTAADANNVVQTAFTTTSATISGTTASGDVITWKCEGF